MENDKKQMKKLNNYTPMSASDFEKQSSKKRKKTFITVGLILVVIVVLPFIKNSYGHSRLKSVSSAIIQTYDKKLPGNNVESEVDESCYGVNKVALIHKGSPASAGCKVSAETISDTEDSKEKGVASLKIFYEELSNDGWVQPLFSNTITDERFVVVKNYFGGINCEITAYFSAPRLNSDTKKGSYNYILICRFEDATTIFTLWPYE